MLGGLLQVGVSGAPNVFSGGTQLFSQAGGLPLFEDTLTFSDSIEAAGSNLLLSDLSFSVETTHEASNLLESSFSLSDARTEHREQVVSSSITLTDAQRQAGSSVVETTITLTDEQDSRTAQTVESTLLFSDAREAVSAGSREVESRLTFTDALRHTTTVEVEDTLTFTTTLLQRGADVLESILTFDDALSQTSVVDDNLVSTLVFSDELELQVASVIELSDTLTFSDAHFFKNPGAIAWVMNTETAAAYWYSNWQFSDMVQVGDVVLAVGPEGLCVIGGNTDAGEAIDAVLKYGFMDFGTEQKKRLPEIVFGYAADTPMAVEVETYGQGYPAFEYRISPQRQSQQPTNGRLTPGKALNARYWRIAVHNTDGGAFSVNSITATVAESARRL